MGGFLKSLFDSVTGAGGEDAAREAGKISAEAARKAAGYGVSATKDALDTTRQYRSQALTGFDSAFKTLGYGKDVYRSAFDPFVQQGQQIATEGSALAGRYLPMLEQGATASGMGQRLGEIYNTDAFRPLIDERQQAAATQLANTGLSRSGAALRAAAAIPTELGFDIENQLYGRQGTLYQSGLGQQQYGLGLGMDASTGLATGLNQVYQNQAQNRQQRGLFRYAAGQDIAGLEQDIGQYKAAGETGSAEAIANARLGGAAARGQGASNLINLGTTGLGFYGASKGWFKP